MHKILIIDDEPTMVTSICDALGRENYHLLTAANGAEGLDVFENERPILIILDLQIPVMEGTEFLKAIGITSSSPFAVIVLAAQGSIKEIRKCFDVGVNAYLRKPFDVHELIGLIRQSIELKQTQLELKNANCELQREIDKRKLVEGELFQANEKLAAEMQGRMRSADKLQTYMERFRSVVQSATDGILLIDESNKIVFWNSGAEKIFGYSANEILGLQLEILVGEGDREEFKKNVEGVLVAGKTDLPCGFVELSGLRRDCSEFPMEISLAFWKANKACFVTGIIRDATLRKNMENELFNAQKLKSVGVLASGIAHEFNNLLTIIIGNIEVAKNDLHAVDKGSANLDRAEEACQRGAGLTQRLLTFSKGGKPVRSAVSIGPILLEAVKFSLSGADISCEFSISEDVNPLEVDKRQVIQVVQNLIVNAQEAMPNGGIIRIAADNIVISESSELPLSSGDYAKIVIEDGGVGIAEDALQKIFDPFYSTKQLGTGLGLSVAYSIVNSHQGHITCESSLGSGTTFSLYLPTIHVESMAKKKAVNSMAACIGKRILVMDDEVYVREYISIALKTAGYLVESAENGEDAIKIYKSAYTAGNRFDLVILDLTVINGMGGGVEAIKLLLQIDPDVKAIIVSGYANDPVMAEYRQYGFHGVVRKPFKIKELHSVIQMTIQGG